MSDTPTERPDFLAPEPVAPLTAGPSAPHTDGAPPAGPHAPHTDGAPPVKPNTAAASVAATPETTPDTIAEIATPNSPVKPRRPSRRPSRRTFVIIGLVVIALIAAGLATWFARQSASKPAPACGSVSGVKYIASDGSFPSLTVALLDGQATPTRVEVVGVWCGVALMDLEYQQTENLAGDHSYTYIYTDVLRAVDMSTGKVLWTLGKSPDGSPVMFDSAVADGGKLALATARDAGFTQPNDAEVCIGGTDIQILNLHTGRAMTSAFIDGQCTPATGDSDTMSTIGSVVAYQAGVVVIEQARGNAPTFVTGGTISTAGYSDADLTKALWTVGSSNTNDTYWSVNDWRSDRTLHGDWVRTASLGMYVPMATGDPSHLSADGLARYFFAAGDLALEADMYAASDNGFFDISGWTDLTASIPAWTYTPPDGWIIAQDDYLMNGFPYPKSLTPVVVTSNAVIVQEERFDGSGVVEANLTAVSTADGTALWTTPYKFAPYDLATVGVFTVNPSTSDDNSDGPISIDNTPSGSSIFSLLARAHATVINLDGKELLVYNEPESVILADAATGQAIASQTMNARTASGIYPCGNSSVCVAVDFGMRENPMQITTTGMMKMAVSASSLGTPSETDLTLMTSGQAMSNVGYDGLYPIEAGLFCVARQGSDYLFVLI